MIDENGRLHAAVGDHGVGDLEEAGDVGAGDVVVLLAVFLGGGVDGLEDVFHDAVQAGVDLFKRPAQAQGVLAHFQGETAAFDRRSESVSKKI